MSAPTSKPARGLCVLSILIAWALMVPGCELGMESSGGECYVSPSALDFGSVPVGSGASLSFVIRNTGTATLYGSVDSGSGNFSVTLGAGPFELEAGQTRQVRVRFSPSGRGTRTGAIGLGTERCASVPCRGVGIGPACLVDPTSLDFGMVPLGSTSERTFSIRNVGEGALYGDVMEGYPDFAILSGDGPFGLVPGQVLSVLVQFEPTSIGVKTGTVSTGTACAQVACLGEGVEGPECVVTPDRLDFGYVPVGSYADLSFGITNVGGGTFHGFVFSDCEGYSVIDGAGQFQVDAGETHVVAVRFAPTSAGLMGCIVELGTTSCTDVYCIGVGYE